MALALQKSIHTDPPKFGSLVSKCQWKQKNCVRHYNKKNRKMALALPKMHPRARLSIKSFGLQFSESQIKQKICVGHYKELEKLL